MTPRSSCPGGESTPLQGANLRLNYEINNVTDTALGNLGAEDTIVLPVWPGPQLQTAWVTFGKQRRVNSGARRRSPTTTRFFTAYSIWTTVIRCPALSSCAARELVKSANTAAQWRTGA